MASQFLTWPQGQHSGFRLRIRSWRNRKGTQKKGFRGRAEGQESTQGMLENPDWKCICPSYGAIIAGGSLEPCLEVRVFYLSDGAILVGGLNWWCKEDLFHLHSHLSSIIICEKNINLEMDKWLENSDHLLSECGVLAQEAFMESISPPENRNVLCVHFSRC